MLIDNKIFILASDFFETKLYIRNLENSRLNKFVFRIENTKRKYCIIEKEVFNVRI